MDSKTVLDAITFFCKNTVDPAYAEIKATLEKKGKRVFLEGDLFFYDLRSYYPKVDADDPYDQPLAVIFQDGMEGALGDLTKSFPEAAMLAAGKAVYLTRMMLVEDPDLIEANNRYLGRFLTATMVQVAPEGKVFAFPLVMFWMRFNRRFHKFQHRYQNEIAQHPLAQISKPDIQNHFLGAFNFFQMFAPKTERPKGF
jgi:hypothetical protein